MFIDKKNVYVFYFCLYVTKAACNEFSFCYALVYLHYYQYDYCWYLLKDIYEYLVIIK